MDTLTAEETEAFYNDIALPPVPPFDTSARSCPSQLDLLVQNGSGEATIAQQGILTGGGSGSSSSTPSEKHGSGIPTPHRGESPLYGSSSTRTLICSTSAPYSSSAATVTFPAASTAAPLQQDPQQPQQGGLAVQEERSLTSSGTPRPQTAGAATAGAATAGAGAGDLAGVALPAAAALAGSRRDTGGDFSGGTVNLFDQQGNQKTAGGRPGCFVPSTSQTPAALPRSAVDSNSSSRATCSYGGGREAAAGGREVLPFAVSQVCDTILSADGDGDRQPSYQQHKEIPAAAAAAARSGQQPQPVQEEEQDACVQALYLAVRGKLFGRTAPWSEFCRLSSFERPATGAVAVDRVERNVRFFFMNYALLCAALGLLAVIMSPAILIVGVIFGGAAAAAGLHGGSSIRLGESTVVPVKNVRYFCGAAGLLTLLCVAGQLIVGLLAGCAVLILLHAALHVGVSYEKIAQHCVDDFDCAV